MHTQPPQSLCGSDVTPSDRQTDRERPTDGYRQRDRQREIERDRQRDRQTDRKRDRQTDRDRESGRQTERQALCTRENISKSYNRFCFCFCFLHVESQTHLFPIKENNARTTVSACPKRMGPCTRGPCLICTRLQCKGFFLLPIMLSPVPENGWGRSHRGVPVDIA